MKIIKKLCVILLVTLITILMIGIAAWILFAARAERYVAAKIQQVLADQFRREVKIGKLQLDLFPTPQIMIADVAIARTQKLSEGTLLSARKLSADVLVWTLFSKQILIDEIVLEQPSVWIEFDEQGRSNLPSFGGEKQEEPKEPSGFDIQNIVDRLYFPSIRLVDGIIHFAHQQIPLSVSVQRLNTTLSLALKGLRLQGLIALQGGEFEWQDRGKMAVAFSGALKFEENTLTLSSFALHLNSSEFLVDGTIANITRPDLNLTVKTKLALEELDQFLHINQNLSGMAAFEATVTGTIPDVTVTGHVNCLEGTAWKLNFANLSTDVTYQQQEVSVTNLSTDMFDGKVGGNVRLSFAGTPRYQGSVTVENINLEYVDSLVDQDLLLAGLVSGTVEVRSDSFDFQDLVLHAAPKIQQGQAYGVAIPRATAQVDIAETMLSITNLDAEMFQGTVTGSGGMALAADPDYHADLAVQQVDLKTMLALIPQPPDVSGQVSGTIIANGAQFDLDSLMLNADLTALNVDAYNIKSKTIRASGQIRQGVLTLSGVSAQLFKGNVSGEGKLVLAGNARPKFDVSAKLANISIQSLIRQFAANVETAGLAVEGNLSGDVTLTGASFNLEDIRGKASLSTQGGVNTSSEDAGSNLSLLVGLDCTLQESRVTIADLTAKTPTFAVQTTGTIDLNTPALNLTYHVMSSDLHTLLAQVLPFLPEMEVKTQLRQFAGTIESLRGTLQGPLSTLQIQAETHVTNGDFFWGQAKDATADVTYYDNRLLIKTVHARYQSAEVDIKDGVIDLTDPAGARLELPIMLKSGDVSDYLAMVKQELPITGTVKAVSTTITGPVENLRGEVPFEIHKGTAWEQSFDRLSGTIELGQNQVKTTSLTLKKNGGTIAVKGFFGFDLSFQAALTATNLNFHDIDALKGVAVQYEGLADITFDAHGTLQNPQGQAAIHLKNLVYAGKAVEDITCDVGIEQQTMLATLEAFHKKFMVAFQLGLTSESRYRVEMTMKQAEVEQILALVMPIEGITGIISGAITSEGSLQELQKLSATVKLSELQLDVFGQPVKNTKDIDVVITPQKLTVTSFELKGKELGLFARGFLDFQGNFDLDVDGIIDLRAVLPFLPKTAGVALLNGRVQLICSVRGTFLNPVVEGVAEISGGSVQVKTYPDPITNIEGKLAFAKDHIEILKLTGEVSKGSFVSHGTLSYQGLTPGLFSIDLEGRNIVVHDVVPALTLTVSPRLRISGDINHQKLTGEVVLSEGNYTKELDLRSLIFDRSRAIVLTPLELGKEEGQIEFDLLVKPPENIQVRKENLQVRNKMAELDLRANLHIQGTPLKPRLEGRVEVLQGKIQFGDITYRIISGVLDFLNPLRINPEMNIRVETGVQAYKIFLDIAGNLDQFTLEMRSEPELPKSQITRLLAAGSGIGTSEYNIVTKPIQTLVEGQIEKAVKLDRFTVDVDSMSSKTGAVDGTPRVTLGKRLFKDLMLTFTTTVGGTEQAQTVEIEYQLSDNMALTVKRDEAGEIDASFTFKFKIK